MITTTNRTRSSEAGDTSTVWKGAGLTAFAAVLFPRLNAVLHEDQKIWQLDREAAILIPLIVLFVVVLFATVGRLAWRAPRNRPATVSVVCGVLAVLGIVAFWISAPIIFGGLALTLGTEGLRRTPDQHRRGLALTGTALGIVGVLVGAAIWIANI
ncbi:MULTISPECIES: hypothetical protein [unclassified Nocardioides]|uniref:hypothetical protein n=1 Tax=unclassified Nocardioides TaxID=2615069 RepID=UPI0000570FD5|nr:MULTISPECIES: hypothetical protein [unclassified Nocardioides]ABL79482.1 hypothetical protein Noca_4900 [Nocardioides sp. JS614]